MNKTIVFASSNNHKVNEINLLLNPYGFKVLSLNELNLKIDAEEFGSTFKDNALIKARDIASKTSYPVLADDSGLCVNALNWEPWVYSARYGWWHWNDAANRAKLLKNLEWKSGRSAYIVCCLVEMFPDWTYIYSEWKTYGTILEEEIWDKSFGYDCVFLSNELHKSFWEATNEEKNSVSHRWRAIAGLLEKEKNDR